MSGPLLLLLAGLAIIGGVLGRARLQGERGGRPAEEEREGEDAWKASIPVDPEEDDPLDEDAIRRAEDEFWEEGWDEPERWE